MTAHAPYFQQLQSALREAGLAQPVLVLDRARLRANLAHIRSHVQRSGHALRVVEKSLPSPALLALVMAELGTQRLMSFHLPFLVADAHHFPAADLLLGKPLPVAALAAADAAGLPLSRPRWLVDTPARLQSYLALAQAREQCLHIVIELDVGLHRGGVTAGPALAALLALVAAHPRHLRFAGFMGYEVHVAKLPRWLGAPARPLARAMAAYAACLQQLRRDFPALATGPLVCNTGGSLTYALHQDTQVANELAVGSACLMPTDFDGPTLAAHAPALFIAAPLLKVTKGRALPGLPHWPAGQSGFLYGGNWSASYCSPPGLRPDPLYGRSSNQERVLAPAAAGLAVDDWVFLRPTQSESVLLQFGDLVVVDQGRVQARWPVYRD